MPRAVEHVILDRDGVLNPELDEARTWTIPRTREAARAAGVSAVLLRTGKGRHHESFAAADGIPVFDDLRALVTELAINRR